MPIRSNADECVTAGSVMADCCASPWVYKPASRTYAAASPEKEWDLVAGARRPAPCVDWSYGLPGPGQLPAQRGGPRFANRREMHGLSADPRTACYLPPDYVPIRHFGRLQSAKAVTVGINPAPNKSGRHAIPLVSGFDRASRSQLHDDDLVSISNFQAAYFDQGNAHAFFDNNFYFVLHTIDESWTYQSGNVAHIDVVFCVTDPLWSKLSRDKTAQASIRRNCRPDLF